MTTHRAMVATLAAVAALVASSGHAVTQHGIRPIVGAGSYFPLQPGNHWVYEKRGATGTSTWAVDVAVPGSAMPQRLYETLTGYFPGTRQVRVGPGGVVKEWAGVGVQENLWYLLGAPVGTTWTIRLAPSPLANPLPDCVSGAKLTVVRRDDVVAVPAGEFHDVVRVDWLSGCVDAGITSEWFAPGFGLVRREESSFAGPQVSELVRADLGGSALPWAAYATTLGLDEMRYVNNLMPPVTPTGLPTAHGVFQVRNSTEAPLVLTFSGCKSVSLVLRNEAGEVVLEGRGDDGGCCTCLSLLPVTVQRGTLALPFSLRLAAGRDAPLADGRYALTATLDTVEPAAGRPEARAVIEVASVH